jgi:hypothetical protein
MQSFAMSALASLTDIAERQRHFRKVPEADLPSKVSD